MTFLELAYNDRQRAAARRDQAIRALAAPYQGLQAVGKPLPLRPRWSENLLLQGGRRLAA